MILRTIHCDVCGTKHTEPQAGAGWFGWGALQGVVLDGAENPSLCPDCLMKIATFANEVKHGMD